MTGQLSIFDYLQTEEKPADKPKKKEVKEKVNKVRTKEDEWLLDRVSICGECQVKYASPECFDRECAEKFHPVSPSKGRKPVIEIERKRRKKK